MKIGLALMLLGGLALNLSAQNSNPQPDNNGVYLPGDGVKAPKLIHTAPARYPSDPRLVSFKHSCIVQVVIQPDGTQSDPKIEGAPSPFDPSAIDAVKASEFKPGTLKGVAVPVRISVWVPFVPAEKHDVPETLPIRIAALGKDDRFAVPLLTPQPEYTEEAKRAKLEGTVLVHLIVDVDGNPQDIQVRGSIGKGLDEKAAEAAAKYKFAPALRWGIPIPFPVTLEINFRLPR
jgi:TonB family protein